MPILNWLGRDEALKTANKTPYRLLEEVPELGYGDKTKENMIVQGDNLEALKALLPFYAGQVKCIYIDPPYNTGNAFENYDDNLEHSVWLSLMQPRLELLKEFLSEDGCIFVQINDDEYPYLKVMCDEVLGRNNYETTFYVKVRHENRILREDIRYQLVVEQVLLYRKSSAFIPPRREKTKNADKDYVWNVEITGQPDSIEKISGYDVEIYKPNNYKIQKSEDGVLKQYQIRGSLITQRGSASEYYEQNLRARREYDGLGCLYKVMGMGVNGDGLGYRYIMQPTKTNSKNGFYFQGKPQKSTTSKGLPYPNFYDWVDVFNNAGYEGGNEFRGGKKPEDWIRFLLSLVTNPNDLVLDSFLGSGTTAAVAHKIGRRYIGIEMGNHAITHCVPRLKAVVDGEQGGISKAVNWQGGGGFRFYKLGNEVFDAEGNINENISFENLSAHIWFTETKTPFNKPTAKSTYLGSYNNVSYALLYNGILRDKRVDGGNVLTNKTLNVILEDMQHQPYEKLVIYGESSRISQTRLKSLNIEFKQTPYDIKAR